MLQKILTFFQKEIVLSISAILAILSMFIVHPSGKYFSYIDFRTLSLLFCLMSIVAGLSEIYHRIACFVMFFLFNDYHK